MSSTISTRGSAHLDVDLVSAENDGDVLADPLEVSVPVGDVLVRDFGGDIEHDDTVHQMYRQRVKLCRGSVVDEPALSLKRKQVSVPVSSGRVLDGDAPGCSNHP